MDEKEFKALCDDLVRMQKMHEEHPELDENRLDPFVEKWRDGEIQVANLIYWPTMLFAALFHGAATVWIVGTICYIAFISHVEKEAIKKSKKRRGK